MSFSLLTEMKTLLEEAFAHTAYRDPAGTDEEAYTPPRFFLCDLPPKRKTEEQKKDFPFVVIMPTEGSDDVGAAEMTVKLLCGVYTAEGLAEAGFQDLYNMTARCRYALKTKQLLAGRFSLLHPVTWAFHDDEYSRMLPYYHAAVTTRWEMRAAENVLSPEDQLRVFGNGYDQSTVDS